ncbi:AAA family ATPase [Pararhizobium sp. DWP3-4]|uniref:AAA family ATPase n=1 Tax=Pararhizobium sp. DWP3-4 TaxID=2804565 RepID=UPI003CED4F38
MIVSQSLLEPLVEGGSSALYRYVSHEGGTSVLMVTPTSRIAPKDATQFLKRELAITDWLDASWAAKPLGIELHDGKPFLILHDAGGQPLRKFLREPFEIGRFLSAAVNVAAAVAKAHGRGIVHKDIRPENILIDDADCVRLAGFGRASVVTGDLDLDDASAGKPDTLQYIAPEQTGRIKKNVDARSDLYSLGVVFYEMLTGELPYVAFDPAEWIHSHVARRPIPVNQRVDGVPPVIAAIVEKLLSKNSDDRYQSAVGLQVDLRRCLDAWMATGRLEKIEVSSEEPRNRLKAPGGLYGRAEQSAEIKSAYDRVATTGRTEVVLISGSAGVGKSSIVYDLRETVQAAGGMFASGKYDQYTRDIPYATIAEAFRRLVHRILSLGDVELARWRGDLLDALGPNGQLMTNLIPELALIIGEQPPPPPLQPHEAGERFHLVFRRFLGVFAHSTHPLALFVDDVQWLDHATIELLERITTDTELRHLLVICAYRDDEVPPEHPFVAARKAMCVGVVGLTEIRLTSLDRVAIGQLIADMLGADPPAVSYLATVVEDKTGGNAFFVLHFLEAIEAEGLINVDMETGVWQWNEGRIQASRITDNVADLVVKKLTKLPPLTLEMVKVLACLGTSATAEILSIVTENSTQQVVGILWEAVGAGLLFRINDAYVFAHDKVQEAAYRMVSEDERDAAHFRIGSAFISKISPETLRQRAFEVADQVSRGIRSFALSEIRFEAAYVCLEAGKRAKATAAYLSALKHLRTGLLIVGQTGWQRYSLKFQLELQRAECEYLSGRHEVAEKHLMDLARHARTRIDRGAVVGLRSSLYLTLGDQAKAVDVALEYLRDFGIEWTAHPSDSEVRAAVDDLYRLLQGRPIEQLVELPKMSDPEWLAAMEVLAYTILPAILTDANLEDIIYTQMVSLSLRHGNCDASCYAYVSVIIPLGIRFGDYASGGRFGQLGLELVETEGMARFKARVYSCYGCFVVPWTQHMALSERFSRNAIKLGEATADLVFSVAAAQALVSQMLISGTELSSVENEAQNFWEDAKRTGFLLAADAAVGQLLFIEDLRGEDDSHHALKLPDRKSYEQYLLTAGERLKLVLAWYWIHRLQVLFLQGDYHGALDAARKAGKNTSARSFIEVAEYHFYSALTHAAVANDVPTTERQIHLDALRIHKTYVDTCTEASPENFSNRSLLLAAETARLEGRQIEALSLYEQAVYSARQYGFIQNEAVANEMAWQFCAKAGLATCSAAFLRKARSCYLAWGAIGKARDLGLRYEKTADELREEAALSEFQQPDVAAVLTMAQAVSGEIVLERLIERLMITVLEHVGAERGVLLLREEGRLEAVAEATTAQEGISVVTKRSGSVVLPHAILQFVSHTQDVVILDDASKSDLFSADDYFKHAGSVSVLCLPLIRQKQLVGVLYLENSLSSHLFTHDQVAVLRVLASQAAISLENAGLYRDAQNNQELARRAAEELRVSYDMVPALVWNTQPDGSYPVFNKRWHDYTGISEEAAREGEWVASFHHEDREKVVLKWQHLLEAGIAGEIEARILRYDGQPRSFLLRVAPLRDEHGATLKWFGTSTDIHDLKRIEEAQELLARAGRLTALGEMTASIAHEVNQPLMAIVTNAATCIRWLSHDQPDIEEARQAAERIIRDGHRAGDVITSIRALARKSPLVMENVDVNSMIEDVLALTRGELQKNRIQLEAVLNPATSSAIGDRPQLQQVVLNLMLNAVEAINASGFAPGRIQVRSDRLDSGDVRIMVTDNGPGVANVDQLFDAFYTTKPGGLGIGLSICRSIVEAHGGKIWVSPAKPLGSTFCFTLKAGEVVDPALR